MTLYRLIILILFVSAILPALAQNVGVGTSTPDQKLDIEGNFTFGENPTHKVTMGFNANGWSYHHPFIKLPGKHNGGTSFMHYLHIHRAIDTLEDRIYYLSGWRNDPTVNIWGSVDSTFNNDHPYHRLVLHSKGIQATNLYIDKGRTLYLNPIGGDIIMGNDTISGNVGIGLLSSANEKLEVNGNFKLDGAIMPAGDAGTNGQLLTSGGANNTPTWSTAIMNSGATSGFGKYFVVLDTIYANAYNSYTITDPNCLVSSSLSASFTGNLPFTTGTERAGVTINNIEARNGEYIISISNYNSFDYINFQMAIIAFY